MLRFDVAGEGQMVRKIKKPRNFMKTREKQSMREINEIQKRQKVRKGQNES